MMKVRSNTKRTSAHNNGNLVSSSRHVTRKITADSSKKKEQPNVGKLDPPNISSQRCVLRDKTNNFATNVKSTVYTPIGYKKSENNSLCSASNLFMVSRKNLTNSFSFNDKQTKGTMKKSEIIPNEAKSDVYEFVLEEGEVNENKSKCKKKSKRKRVQRKIIDSPEEVLPAKKNRKPLQDKVSKNFIHESNPRNTFKNKELNPSSAKSFSDILHPAKMKMKTVHFNNLPHDEIIKSSSGMQKKFSTPKHGAKKFSSPENVQLPETVTETNRKGGTPNLLTSLHPSSKLKSVKSCMTEINQPSFPSVSECDRLDKRMNANEVSRKLLSFFSPVHTSNNSHNNYSVAVTEKTPAKQVTVESINVDMENTETDHSENVQPSLQSVPAEQQCEKINKTLDVSNYFGFDDDAETEDEDFSPVKTFTKSSHKLGKFQCSTPKEVGQKNGASQPFRFPALSIVKKRKFLQLAGNTPATVTNLSRETPNECSDSTSKRPPCIPGNSPVKKSSKPAIFDLEEEVQGSQDEKYEDEQQQSQVTLKDSEAVYSPQKKVAARSYVTPRHGTRVKRQVYDDVKEDHSEDEAGEIVRKKHKKTHRPPKTKEADEWAKCFNSMCETIDSFELVVE